MSTEQEMAELYDRTMGMLTEDAFFPAAAGVARAALKISIENVDALLRAIENAEVESFTAEMIQLSQERQKVYLRALEDASQLNRERGNATQH